jgi:uncharacterized protein YbjQ (UPF0145 family)
MIVTTTENIAGQEVVESLGQVFGVVVRSRGLAGNIVAALRTIIGGEIKEYSALVEDGQTMNEVVAYGTAVKLAKPDGPVA